VTQSIGPNLTDPTHGAGIKYGPNTTRPNSTRPADVPDPCPTLHAVNAIRRYRYEQRPRYHKWSRRYNIMQYYMTLSSTVTNSLTNTESYTHSSPAPIRLTNLHKVSRYTAVPRYGDWRYFSYDAAHIDLKCEFVGLICSAQPRNFSARPGAFR